MLFQGDDSTIVFVLGLLIATIIVALVIYITVILIESKHKASDKTIMIILLALIIVFLLPIILNAVGEVLSRIGQPLADIMDPPNNYLTNLVPIIGFLLILVLAKLFISLDWESALWVSLLALFILYIIFTIVPDLYDFVWNLF